MPLTRKLIRKAWCLLFVFPIGFIFIYLNQFIFSSGAQFSDLVISHLPNAIFLKASLAAGQGIPFWSPAILSGYPFVADPLSGLYYPVGWLAAILPWAVGFNLLAALHLLWGGIGVYVYLSAEGLKRPAALAGALIFESLPKLFAHFEAGHISLVYAVCWTPWLLLAEAAWGQATPWSREALKRLWRAPGVVLGLIFLIDSRWAAFAGMIWLAYTLANNHHPKSSAAPQAGPAAAWVRIGAQLALAACIAAPLAVPLLQFARLSSRASLAPDEAFSLSLPPARLLGLIFPDFQGTAEWTFYPGCFALLFAITCLFSKRLRTGAGFWLWIVLAALVYSLGSAIPGLKYLAYLPGFDLLRVPPRVLFAAGLAFSILSARAVAVLLEPDPTGWFSRRVLLNLLLAGTAFFAVLFGVVVAAFSSTDPFNYVWGAGCLAAAAVWLILRLSGKLNPGVWAAGVIGLGLLNTGVVDFKSMSPRSPAQVLSENGAVAGYLVSQAGGEPFRVYSPSYSLPQQTAVQAGLELADGVDPLQLAAYDRFMAGATGIPVTGYSVTQPPFASGDPATDNQAYAPDPIRLGLINVKYVLADFDLKPVKGLVLEKQIGSTRIYVNKYSLPRAWVQPAEPVRLDEQFARSINSVVITRSGPNEIDIRATGPGELVLSEINYPGWTVWVDGKAGPVKTAYDILRQVALPPGEHTVVFKFVPAGLYLGIALFAVPWLIALLSALVLGARSRGGNMATFNARKRSG